MDGTGIFFRDPGKLPPTARKLLEQVGDEKITSMTLFRNPISLSKFAKFVGALKGTNYDDLFHLGVIINGKYLLDKQAVLHFERSGIPKDSETLQIPIAKEITISELLEKTRKRMGDSNFSSYNAKSNNCQDFMLAVLSANGLSSPELTKFIKQNVEAVFNNLPSYAEAISNFVTGTQAVADRVIQGEGTYIHNFGLHRAKCRI